MIKLIIILISLLSAITSFNIMVGSFIKTDLNQNDMYIDRAVKAVYNELKTKFKGDEVSNFFPFALYKQIVNGINYKLIYIYGNPKSKQVNLSQSIVYTGPFSEGFSSNPTVISTEILSKDLVEISEITNMSLKSALLEYVDLEGYKNIEIKSVTGSPKFVYDENYYLINFEADLNNSKVNAYVPASEIGGKFTFGRIIKDQ